MYCDVVPAPDTLIVPLLVKGDPDTEKADGIDNPTLVNPDPPPPPFKVSTNISVPFLNLNKLSFLTYTSCTHLLVVSAFRKYGVSILAVSLIFNFRFILLLNEIVSRSNKLRNQRLPPP